MSSKIKINFFSLFAVLTLFIVTSAAAQTMQETDTLPPVTGDTMKGEEVLPDVSMLKKTHPEKIVFSQYKLAKDIPNFDNLANSSPLVKQAQDIDKSAMMLSEYNRISNNFNMHDEKQAIVIHTMLQADEYSSLQNLLIFDELDKTTFFRFRMYDNNIGIVPDEIASFGQLQFPPNRADMLYSNDNKPPKQVMAEFIVKPYYADRKNSIMVNGEPFWLMSANIVEARLWTSNNPKVAKLIWYYQADDYNPANVTGLDNLYNQ